MIKLLLKLRRARSRSACIKNNYNQEIKGNTMKTVFTLLALLIAGAAHADLIIGQTAGFTGVVAAGVKETTEGAKLYIDGVNAKGGVGGQRITLVSLDDKFDPKLAAENARKLIKENGAIALFLSRGTPHAEAMIPVLDEFNVPLIAPSTGAMVLHQPIQKNVFNVRTPYQLEAAQAVRLLKNIGLDRIGVLYTDDSFGLDALAGARTGLEQTKIEPVYLGKFDRSKPDFALASTEIVKANANAVLVFGASATVADAARAIRAAGSTAKLVTLSNNASAGFVKALGEHAKGVVVTQVFPGERSSALFAQVSRVAKAKGITEVSPAMLEGYAGAAVLVEGLRRAGKNPTGIKLRAALETLRNFEIGAMKLDYSATDHTGLSFTDLSVISKDGTFAR
jgi:branched-chain amino acid transport system substrate-binding protein